MQEVVDPFAIIAEFSIGLAGFAGIVAAFDRERIQQNPVLRFRFMMLLFMAFSPGFFSLIAICTQYFGQSLQAALQMTSAFAVVCIAMMIITTTSRRPPDLPRAMLAFMFSATFFNLGLYAVIALNTPAVSLGLFLSALVLTLFQAAVVFAVTVLSRYKESP